MLVELTEQELTLIRQALNSVPVKGATAMAAVLQLLAKLAPQQKQGSDGQ